jgi:hypothetical protein
MIPKLKAIAHIFIDLALLPLELIHWLPSKLSGGAPQLQTTNHLRHCFKTLRNIKVTKTKVTSMGGYLYYEFEYDDGSKLLLR